MYAGFAGIQGVELYAGTQGVWLGCMLYRVLVLVMYAAGGCVCAIMVAVAGQARFPGPGQRETLITL